MENDNAHDLTVGCSGSQDHALNKVKIVFLKQLALIVCDIDDIKLIDSELVWQHAIKSIPLLNQMRLTHLDTGMLTDIFFSIQVWHAQVKYLPILIGKAHEEIIRLLGNDAWQIYGFDDDGQVDW